MKKLNPDGSITIPSNTPRNQHGPDSRGIRICFSQLGRSCSLKQGYLIFTDGSAYAYDMPSNSDVEALCDQAQRGKVFNFVYRRSRGGFVRGFTPPADYETIYSYPPYPGVAPTACPLPGVDWANLAWTFTRNDLGGMTYTETPGVGNSATQLIDATSLLGDTTNQHVNMIASVSYNGPAVNCTARLQVTVTNPTAQRAANVFLDLGAGFFLVIDAPVPGNSDDVFPFTVADTGGTPVSLGVFISTGGWNATSIGDFQFLLTMANA